MIAQRSHLSFATGILLVVLLACWQVQALETANKQTLRDELLDALGQPQPKALLFSFTTNDCTGESLKLPPLEQGCTEFPFKVSAVV